jgi:hypothetical protein
VEGEGTLVPDTSSGYFVDMEAFRRKLRAADFVKGTEEGFDLQAFADSVRFVILYDDSNKNPYYHIAAGENEDIYRMYVGVTYHDMDYFEAMFIIYHKKEHCRLYKEA